jgi:hypothetical protein
MSQSRHDIEALVAQIIVQDPSNWRKAIASVPDRLDGAGLMTNLSESIPELGVPIPDVPETQQQILVSYTQLSIFNVVIPYAVASLGKTMVMADTLKLSKYDSRQNTRRFTEPYRDFFANGSIAPLIANSNRASRAITHFLATDDIWGSIMVARDDLRYEYLGLIHRPTAKELHQLSSLDPMSEPFINTISTVYFMMRHAAKMGTSDQCDVGLLSAAFVHRANRARGSHRKILTTSGIRIVTGSKPQEKFFLCALPPTDADKDKYGFPDGYSWQGDRFGAQLYDWAGRLRYPSPETLSNVSHQRTRAMPIRCPVVPPGDGSRYSLDPSKIDVIRPFVEFVLRLDKVTGHPLSAPDVSQERSSALVGVG